MRVRLSSLLALLILLMPAHGQDELERPEAPVAPEAPERSPETAPDPDEERNGAGETVRFRRLGGPVIFSNFVLKTNESVGDVVVIGGDAEIDGIVEGSLVLIGGRAKINGTIEGETVIVLGGADVGESARLEREVVLIGGPFNIDPGAQLDRERVEIALGDVARKMEWFKRWLFEGLLLGRLLPLGITWPWIVAGMFAFVYLTLLLIFPGAARGTVQALEERPVTSIAVGMLTLVLFAPLVFLLAISLVGIVVIPFLQIAFVLLVLFGKVGVLCLIGRSLGRSSRLDFLERLFPAFVVGVILLTIAYALPVAGVLVWAVTTVFGLGGAVVALSNTFYREETAPPAPVVVGRGPRPDPPALNQPGGGTATAAVPASAVAIAPGDTVLMPRAGFWTRILAMILDLVLLSLLLPLTGPFTVLIGVAYFVAMWTWKGTTIGSIVLGLKVVRTDGEPVNFAVALVRSLSSLFSAMFLFLGFFWAAWDRDKQSWHDKIAGTVVVRMPKDFALV